MKSKLSNASLSKLTGLHPKLVEVVKLAIQKKTDVDFKVIEGIRSNDR